MCGIAGFFGRSTLPSSILEQMTQAIAHRGPDDEGHFGWNTASDYRVWKHAGQASGNFRVGLGFRRLSIIDLSSNGAQPMSTADGRFWITFNGEIYNYVELKEFLHGAPLKSTSDTEVLLELLARDGIEALQRLNGIFAFSFFDRETGKLILARDHFGTKPLYYFEDERGLFYSSEIRSLLKIRKDAVRLNTPLLARYLLTNWIPDPDTMFEGIKKLPPGHYLTIDAERGVQVHPYWDMHYQADDSVSLSHWIESLDAAVSHSVERQLRSDVPIGFFLSGGVDSSLLAFKAKAMRPNPPTTFTVGFKWNENATQDPDVIAARLLQKKFGFKHREILLEPSIVALLPKVVETLEEPIADPAALCSYLICQAAARDFKVMISGQGGDELFGGYPVYRGGLVASRLQSLPTPVLNFLNSASQRLPYSIGNRRFQTVQRLKKLFTSATHAWPNPFFELRSAVRPGELQELLTDDVKAVQEPAFGRHALYGEKAKDWDRLQQMMYFDIKTYLPALNLTYTDKTSMAHSVEVRVPLLDLEIVNLIARVPSKYKMDLQHSKILLKKYAERMLPKEIVYRKKAGFGLPLQQWFLKDLQPMAQDYLSAEKLNQQGLFNPVKIQRWLDEHRLRIADHSLKIYSLMTFQIWMERFNVRP